MDSDDKACPHCGHVGPPQTHTPGSIRIEFLLWLLFLLPGLIYSVWRLHARHEVCAKCGADHIVPIDTPRGRELALQAGYPAQLLRDGASRPPSKAAYGFGRRIGRLFSR